MYGVAARRPSNRPTIAARTMSRLFLFDMAMCPRDCGQAEKLCKPRATRAPTDSACSAGGRWLADAISLSFRLARTLLTPRTVRAIWSVLSRAVLRFSDDESFTLGAALAYYSLLSMAPLLLIAVSLAGAFFAYGDVRMELVDQMHRLTGP